MEITFTEEKRNLPHWSPWHHAEIDYIDTHFTIDGTTRFLKGVAEPDSNLESREMGKLKQQLISNEAKYIRFYCHAPIEDCHPLSFLGWVRKEGLTFEPFSKFRWVESLQAWEFEGNLREYSSVFKYRIWDRSLALRVRKQFAELSN